MNLRLDRTTAVFPGLAPGPQEEVDMLLRSKVMLAYRTDGDLLEMGEPWLRQWAGPGMEETIAAERTSAAGAGSPLQERNSSSRSELAASGRP
jgi:hypothetical protein